MNYALGSTCGITNLYVEYIALKIDKYIDMSLKKHKKYMYIKKCNNKIEA